MVEASNQKNGKLTMEYVSCNLCGSAEASLVYLLSDYLLENDNEVFRLVKCSHCGLVYQNPRPTADELNKYYPQEYKPYYQEQYENRFWRMINLIGVKKRCRIVNSLKLKPKAKRLLDIGCSTGIFLNEVRKNNMWQVSGNDTSEYATKIAREQYHLEVYHGDVFQAKYPDQHFDVVTLWDVLEHLPDPSSTLNEIYRISTPGSYVVLRVPNYSSLDSRLFGPAWAGLDAPRHYYVFSMNNIKRLLDSHGYRILKIQGNIGEYVFFLLSIRFWLYRHSYKTSLRLKITSILNHPISRIFFSPIFYFYGLFLLGSEIIVIAQKKD